MFSSGLPHFLYAAQIQIASAVINMTISLTGTFTNAVHCMIGEGRARDRHHRSIRGYQHMSYLRGGP